MPSWAFDASGSHNLFHVIWFHCEQHPPGAEWVSPRGTFWTFLSGKCQKLKTTGELSCMFTVRECLKHIVDLLEDFEVSQNMHEKHHGLHMMDKFSDFSCFFWTLELPWWFTRQVTIPYTADLLEKDTKFVLLVLEWNLWFFVVKIAFLWVCWKCIIQYHVGWGY